MLLNVFMLYCCIICWLLGYWLFVCVVCLKVLYFVIIGLCFIVLEFGCCVVCICDCCCVYNYIGMVYVIVLCNLVELSVGVMIDVIILLVMCWILCGMVVDYLVKVVGIMYVMVILEVLVVEVVFGYFWFVCVSVCNDVGEEVFCVCIDMWVFLCSVC